MKKILISFILLLFIVACAGHAIIREYKYSYKMKNAEEFI